MSISSVGSAMTGLAAAQSMFGVAAQVASGVSSSDPASSAGIAAEAVQVAVLQKALSMERSLVNILA